MADLLPNRAGMICFNRAGMVLICTATGKDCIWVFPKGHIEKDEQSYEAAERETLEECSVQCVVDTAATKPLGVTTYKYKGEDIRCEWWCGLAFLPAPDQDGELAWGFRKAVWVTWERALQLLTFPDHRNLLRRALCMEEDSSDDKQIFTKAEELNL